MGDAIVRCQIFGPLRPTAPLQIGRRRTQHRKTSGQPARHHAIVQAVGDAHGQVDALGHQVDSAVHRQQFHLDARVHTLEVDDGLRQARHRERQAGGHAQLALRFGATCARHGLQVCRQFQHLAQARQCLQAGFAQAHTACRAVQQPHTQPAFQASEMAADHGTRQLQHLGRACQAALVGNLDEGADGRELVHGLIRNG